MNLFFKCCLISVFLFCLNGLKAQENFLPGYVITSKNDTLKGLINDLGYAKNSRSCNFKQNQDSEIKEYFPEDIKGYKFTDGSYYVSKKIRMNNQDQIVFLEFLVNGIADLYFLREEINTDHFFIEKSDDQLFELTNTQEFVNKDGQIYTREKKEYIGFFKIAFENCPKIYPLLDELSLDKKSLINITKKYHDYVCDSAKCIIYEKHQAKTKVKLAPFVSMNTSNLKLAEKYSSQIGLNFSMSNYMLLGIQMSAYFPDVNDRLTFQFSEEVGKSNFYSTDYSSEKIKFNTTISRTRAGIKYSTLKGTLRPTAAAGIHTTFMFNEINNVILHQEKTLRDLGYNFDLGMDYFHSSSLRAFLSVGYSFAIGYSSYDSNTANINVGFYF